MRLMLGLFLTLMVGSFALSGQEPGPAPLVDTVFDCVDQTASAPPFKLHYQRYPAGIQTEINTPIVRTDVTPPVITNVFSGAASVFTNNVVISPTAYGVPFSISAGDDVRIVSASLFVDDKVAIAIADDDGYNNLFYMRWNARASKPGVHNFKLVVWDKAGNLAEKTWTMHW